jgi:SAM-dependent methyltransferase
MPLANQTRVSPSIPRRLLREGRFHLLPVYYVLRLSFLAREGIERSGSRHFADHIYVGKPRGAWGVGRLIDKVLLSLPSSRSFRNRYIHTRDGLVRAVMSSPRDSVRVLTVPCGVPRDLAEAAERVRTEAPQRFDRTTFLGLDVDPAAVAEARELLRARSLAGVRIIEGDALDGERLPGDLDAIASTGFTEFLCNEDVVRFYANCYDRLCPGGVLITSATVEHKFSSYLLRNIAELSAHYRDVHDVAQLFRQTPFGKIATATYDPVGYQVLITAVREGGSHGI